VKEPKRQSDPLASYNELLETGDWIKDVIWDARRVSSGLLADDEEEPRAVRDLGETTTDPAAAKSNLDPYNLSNDHLYEHTRESRFRIRQTFGAIEVFHSHPTKDLQMPFVSSSQSRCRMLTWEQYKTTLSKSEARAWRRPAIQIPVGITIIFSKLKSNPSASVSSKKKAMMVDPSERFRSSKDLTMAEKGPFVLFEFSVSRANLRCTVTEDAIKEEYPPMMSGYGMGTTIVNYYRKKDDKDEHVPKVTSASKEVGYC